jgi:hypothetical protein
MGCKLLPFRDYDEHEVINLFRFSGTVPVDQGTIVTITNGAGWDQSNADTQFLGAAGKSYDNTVSDRYGVYAQVKTSATGDANPLGMLLHSVKETDENGEKLLYNPRKMAEMEVVLSGQAVPIVTRGIFLYSGSTIDGETVDPGAPLYSDANGLLTKTAGGADQAKVAQALGPVDATYKSILIKLEL